MTNDFEATIREFLKDILVDVMREVVPRPLSRKAKCGMADAKTERMLLRASEVAELLGISERGLHTLTRDGTLPCVRIGRLVRYNPDTIREWITSSESAKEVSPGSRPTRVSDKPRRKTTGRIASRKTKTTAGRRTTTDAETSNPRRPRRKAKVVRKKQDSTAIENSESRPRTTLSFFADRLGVDENVLPRMTNGEIMRIAEIDIPTLHGWQYHNRDIPETAISKLHDYFVAYLARED